MRYVVVDPGLKTGVVEFTPSTRRFSAFELGAFQFMEYCENMESRYVYDSMRIICESYIVTTSTAKKTQQLWSLKHLGTLQYLCYKHSWEFYTQNPDERMFSTDVKLKALGWYTEGLEGHANDAARHLLRYLWDKKRLTQKEVNKVRGVVSSYDGS